MSLSKNFMESKTALNFEDPSIFHDRVLVVGEKKFHVVSGVLSVWSEFFRVLFNGNFDEANKKEIELKDVDAEDFNIFLQLVYQNNSVELQGGHLIPLIDLADRFLTPNILAVCREYIDNNFLDIEVYYFKLLESSLFYGIEELKAKLIDSFNDQLNEYLFSHGYFIIKTVVEWAFKHDVQLIKDGCREYIFRQVGDSGKRI